MGPRVALAVAVCALAALPAPADARAQSAPPLLLVGVILSEPGEPMAILEDPQTHEQALHVLGAHIGPVRLTEILKDRVILTSGDALIEVRLAGPPPPSRGRAVPFRPPPGRARRTIPR